jgi:hypothetical protein
MSRWNSEAIVAAIARMRDDVGGFARMHGMSALSRQSMDLAVAEAVAGMVVPPLGTRNPAGRIEVSAATDGAWMSIRVEGDRCGAADLGTEQALPLASALADRVERSSAIDGGGTTVVMEFPMEPASTPIGQRGMCRGGAHRLPGARAAARAVRRRR